MSKETKVVLVDKNDRVLGLKEKFATHKIPVPLHRAVSIVIFNKNKSQTLITKRSAKKPTWPLFWSNAVCTHPYPTEAYKDAAQRRLKEELGFRVPLREVFRFVYQAKYDKTWGENEYDVVFVGQYGGGIKTDASEVADYKWVDINGLSQDVQNNPDNYSPWFKIILKKLRI